MIWTKCCWPTLSESPDKVNLQMDNSRWQSGLLVTLRFLIGWHLLYEGIVKVLNPGWSAYAFLEGSQGFFAGVADWITSNQGILSVVDALNTWGLVAIGLALVLGLFTRPAAFAGATLLGLYYLFNPPFIGIVPTVPMEGSYLIVNKNLIEAVALLLIAVSPAARSFAVDALFVNRKDQ
jgi:thiosulfate dehydrogenase (quinone) large subunit